MSNGRRNEFIGFGPLQQKRFGAQLVEPPRLTLPESQLRATRPLRAPTPPKLGLSTVAPAVATGLQTAGTFAPAIGAGLSIVGRAISMNQERQALKGLRGRAKRDIARGAPGVTARLQAGRRQLTARAGVAERRAVAQLPPGGGAQAAFLQQRIAQQRQEGEIGLQEQANIANAQFRAQRLGQLGDIEARRAALPAELATGIAKDVAVGVTGTIAAKAALGEKLGAKTAALQEASDKRAKLAFEAQLPGFEAKQAVFETKLKAVLDQAEAARERGADEVAAKLVADAKVLSDKFTNETKENVAKTNKEARIAAAEIAARAARAGKTGKFIPGQLTPTELKSVADSREKSLYEGAGRDSMESLLEKSKRLGPSKFQTALKSIALETGIDIQGTTNVINRVLEDDTLTDEQKNLALFGSDTRVGVFSDTEAFAGNEAFLTDLTLDNLNDLRKRLGEEPVDPAAPGVRAGVATERAVSGVVGQVVTNFLDTPLPGMGEFGVTPRQQAQAIKRAGQSVKGFFSGLFTSQEELDEALRQVGAQ